MYIIYVNLVMSVMDVIQDNGTGISVQGEMINNLRFANDIDLVEESCVALQNSVKLLSEAGIDAGLRTNIEKTKIMIFGQEDIEQQIEVLNSRIENVKENLVQVVMRRKLSLFGHICRMENERKIKSVMLGSMDGRGKRGRPKREWLDDIRDWCQKDIQTMPRCVPLQPVLELP